MFYKLIRVLESLQTITKLRMTSNRRSGVDKLNRFSFFFFFSCLEINVVHYLRKEKIKDMGVRKGNKNISENYFPSGINLITPPGFLNTKPVFRVCFSTNETKSKQTSFFPVHYRLKKKKNLFLN